MLSVVLYGRNDSYGYNLHKRAALSINCIAELLSEPDDEILFVDYNTPNDYPTFPEAIQDTLTEKAWDRLRILRVRPQIHARFAGRTHLAALEPIARNIAIRRSNESNRWVLSTNTDMIFVPHTARSLSAIAAELNDGFFHLPRFEIPETLWETFDRKDPARVIAQVGEWGRTAHLNEIVFGEKEIKFDGPGDFQLLLRSDLFRFHGFHEDMILGWHVDSNIAKRFYLAYGEVGDVSDELYGYHCDHTRQVTPAHKRNAAANDIGRFFTSVTRSDIPEQAAIWGCPDDTIEEVRLRRAPSFDYVRGLRTAIEAPMERPTLVAYNASTYDKTDFDPRHVLPFLADSFVPAPRQWSVAWEGAGQDMLALFHALWTEMAFTGSILVEPWSAHLLRLDELKKVEVVERSALEARANVFVFDFGKPSAEPRSSGFVRPGLLDERVLGEVRGAFLDLAHGELKRILRGEAHRRFIAIGALHNEYEQLFHRHVGAASTPFGTRVRHGFVHAERPGAVERITTGTKEGLRHWAKSNLSERQLGALRHWVSIARQIRRGPVL